METPNAYLPGENSVAENSWKAYEAQREGQLKTAGLFFDHREAPAEVDPEDYDSLRDGLRTPMARAPTTTAAGSTSTGSSRNIGMPTRIRRTRAASTSTRSPTRRMRG